MKVFKKLITLIFLLSAFIIISAWSYAQNISNSLSDSVFRLHVIANSDSEEDQNLKYTVRDNLIQYMNTLTQNISSKAVAMQIAEEHKDDFYTIAKNTINEYGYDYDVKIEIGQSFFPTKNYGDILLPAGYYDALKVEIGECAGQNWWCVMFPPLCFVDMSTGIVPDESKETIRENLNSEEYALISKTNNASINFKFKLIEFFNHQ
ncbi:MAG: stage II sporulation protein R [Clostridia bacterium]|nr:stage II sporulation protein R [Clostridia bacterium]